MDWGEATSWWVAAGALVAVELGTGTFYLLMLALGAAAAALCAHAGVGLTGQLVAASLVGGGAVAACHFQRGRQPTSSNRDINLDIGARIHVGQWNTDGSTRAKYRGTKWDVRYNGEGTPEPGEYIVRAVEGSTLLLDK